MADDTEVKLAFKRVKRDCVYNANANPGEKLVYDHDVYADGVLIATFLQREDVRGYRLVDLYNRSIKNENGRTVYASKKDCMVPVIRSVLGRIPTPEQIEAYKAELAEQAAAEQRRREERDRIYRIKEAGVELLNALDAMIRAYPAHAAAYPEQTEAHAVAAAAIALATSKEGE